MPGARIRPPDGPWTGSRRRPSARLGGGADGPERLAERSADRSVLVRALRLLPAAQREAVLLAFWGELPSSEIAKRTRVPLGTAKSRVRLGVEKLGELIPPAEAAA